MPLYDTSLVTALARHANCSLKIETYGETVEDGDDETVQNATVECIDHGEVIVDAEAECQLPFHFQDHTEDHATEDSSESEETPSENVLVTAQAPMNILRDGADSLSEALENELEKRMSPERRAAFFNDANFVVSPLEDAADPSSPAEVDPLGYYVCGGGTAYGPYNSEDRAYRRAARRSENNETEYTVERGAVIADACLVDNLTIKEPDSNSES
jgi:hypothetical protein